MSLTAIVCFGVLFSAGSMALIYFSASMAMLIIAGACFGLGAGVVSPAMNSISVLSAKPEARGRASATYFFALDVSTAVGAWVLGLVASAYSLREVFAVSGVLVLGALLLILWLHCTQRLPRKGF